MKRKNIIKDKINNRIIGLTLYFIAVVFMVAMLIHLINGSKGSVFGYTARIVVSGSMEPRIKTNSLSLIKHCSIKSIHKDDVICFRYSQDIVHRVVEVTTNESGETVIHTKGDANEKADNIEVNGDMLIGKVVYTANWLAPIIAKYSISPGKVDSVTLSRSIMSWLIVFGIVLFIAIWIASLIRLTIRAFIKDDDLDSKISEYLKDIDELMLYKELLEEIRSSTDIKDKKSIEFITNRIAKAKTEIDIKNLHYAVKDFKKSVRQGVFITKLGKKLESNKKDKKSVELSRKDKEKNKDKEKK